MSVAVEFTIPSDAFTLGQVLSADTEIEVSLEAIVPTDDDVLPFFWLETSDADELESFEQTVREHPMVQQLTPLDRLDDGTLYRAKWKREPESLVAGIRETNGTVLSARGTSDRWTFTVRFEDHGDLTAFQNFLTEHGIRVHFDRITNQTETRPAAAAFDLTDQQREALVSAVSRGYFEVPRRANLSDVAADLDITRQAASELVRRGANTVLRKVLLEA